MPPQASGDPAENQDQVSDFRKENPITPNPPLDPVAQKLKKARDAERANETPEQREAREASGEEQTGEAKEQETVESLMDNNTREQLDKLAASEGVENPDDMVNKHEVAEAIIANRKK